MNAPLPPEPFNPNVGSSPDEVGGFPVFDNVLSVEAYHEVFSRAVDSYGSLTTFLTEIKKNIKEAPESHIFANFSLMPDTYNSGVLQWPGVPPQALQKVVRENLAPMMIINMRVDDVLRYSELSTHPWKPGWKITMRAGLDAPTKDDLKDIRAAEMFIQNCNAETGLNARGRDAKNYLDFTDYLSATTRDTLTYDGFAIWTDMSLNGQVKAFRPYSAANIRLCPKGYKGDPEIFAVAVDEAGNIKGYFTRDQLVWRVRNRRLDADIFNYGFPEIEQGIRLVQGFTNAFDMNADTFTKNSTPNGILTVQGQWTQRQLDVLSRIWGNLKRGNTKSWALPVIPIPKDGKLEIVDMSMVKGNDVRYQDYMNMVAGAFCTIYRFPPKRLGYRISGAGPDARPEREADPAAIIDEADPGLMPLLHHHETIINQYLLWTRWPHLMFTFTGKNPKEDAREYEARLQAMTYNERRAIVDLPALESLAKGPHKELATLMGLAAGDSSLSGIWQSMVSAYISAKMGGSENDRPEQPGAMIQPKKDPARSEAHGATSGVRRNSAAETKKADNEAEFEGVEEGDGEPDPIEPNKESGLLV
jgi:hypothetical protein